MNIIKMYPEEAANNKKMVYAMTRATSISASKLEDGSRVVPVAYCLYEDTNSKGETNKVLAIMTDTEDHAIVSTISETFQREFQYIADLMDGEDYAVLVKHGVTKAGREFTTCELDCN